ncbi:MAG: TlyA family RNA methyltransferase [Minisyncoccia bacterium]
MKQRLDLAIVSRNLSRSRTEAHDRITHGKVLVNGVVETKPAKEVSDSDVIRITEYMPFVGRGGVKLQHALEYFHIDVGGKTILDVGSSTGGFTDCLLQNGAQKVYAVDVGTFQMADSLRNNPHVVLMEQTDIREAVLPEKVAGVVVDVSFISLSKIFPSLSEFVAPGAFIVALIKPQFEVGQTNIGKGGVVTSDDAREDAITQVLKSATENGISIRDVTPSPIVGGDGNKEFLLFGTYAL